MIKKGHSLADGSTYEELMWLRCRMGMVGIPINKKGPFSALISGSIMI
jgi:hypothetical protein